MALEVRNPEIVYSEKPNIVIPLEQVSGAAAASTSAARRALAHATAVDDRAAAAERVNQAPGQPLGSGTGGQHQITRARTLTQGVG